MFVLERCPSYKGVRKPPQFYKLSQSLELVTIVIVINAVIGRFNGEDLK